MSASRERKIWRINACAGCLIAVGVGVAGTGWSQSAPAPAPGARAAPARIAPVDGSMILAVVNGDVISLGDVAARRRLFALGSGQGASPETLERLTPQVTRQLIDERLRLQEVRRRKIVVSDQDIANAIRQVEASNGMAPGALRQRLAADGVNLRTMIDQVRVQIGWGRVLRELLGSKSEVSEADIKQQEDILRGERGRAEFRLSEIFVPINDPGHAADASRFAETIIGQLRGGAPFAVIAAQFSQSQTALQGGDMGWVQASELDPTVLRVVEIMPPGAISNPVPVPGGLSIVAMRAKREIGNERGTVVHLRQTFFKFSSKLDPRNPTAQQRATIDQASKIAASVKTCAAMEEVAKAAGDPKGGDPGEVVLEGIGTPALRQVMATLPLERASQPLIADDGVAVMIICSRESKAIGLPNRKEIADRVLNDRIELASRQLMRDLRRRSMIDLRS